MIPQAYINEWRQQVPWKSNEQVEQDLVICRTLLEIFSDEWLASNLAFRGGTALHKLYLRPQPRYSEDIDLVQIQAGPIRETVERLQHVLAFLGESSVNQRHDNTRIVFRFISEFPPSVRLRLKVEVNTREHFTVLGYEQRNFEANSTWINEVRLGNSCKITTYQLEELLGTKLRALYQRKKGRDLFDLSMALLLKPNLDLDKLMRCYKEYMLKTIGKLPTQREYLLNLEGKMEDDEFLNDTAALIRPDLPLHPYNPTHAFELIKNYCIERM
ncbi:nucleotidyl transferase AbiEii/AbiGii toxin family protein [Thermaurantimonas aggregans]|uniref:nucleotidyl transferase AbiEii/AbiGii toxin family protein n=1 Tax=Thermaurantimonas aggregans TaxID=2173829 RepID=UPI0023F5814C|nr:nucleotidyl transferase AbiEii/AbiGii toxin family protein [Thermaurantimonas aggregans]MCS6974001.1 nucleotidyl transferase AbiEii/AbiGii toxin family protein [Cyclobacteriaceae bacterium]MCX8149857.1 nucleotidyl transferase AbiEii/AbiGii toxin family protein [Thermaurantimonas aggregans]MDW8331082.1 nucleotidyl transferase AbiEii/AbiGii toxin family protein [Cyclobacteriaceae bacterium]